MKSHQFLKICRPEMNGDQFKVDVGPGNVKIVKYKMDPEGNGGYSLSFGFSSSISLGSGKIKFEKFIIFKQICYIFYFILGALEA